MHTGLSVNNYGIFTDKPVELDEIDDIIVTMKSILGKYFYPFLAAIIIEVIIVFIAMVDSFRTTGDFAGSVHDFFTGIAVIGSIYSFIADWATVLSIVLLLAIIVLVFFDIRRIRRSHSLSRIHDWAQNSVLILADYRQRDDGLHDSPSIRQEGIKLLINALKVHSSASLANAKVIGGELEAKTIKAVETFNAIDEKVARNDDSAFNDLRTLQHDMADVMTSTFELQQDL